MFQAEICTKSQDATQAQEYTAYPESQVVVPDISESMVTVQSKHDKFAVYAVLQFDIVFAQLHVHVAESAISEYEYVAFVQTIDQAVQLLGVEPPPEVVVV